jgi:hypothetical protein
MRERVEERIDEILAPYFDQLTGAVMFAKWQGEVIPSEHPDTGARIEAAEALLDRVYGRPTQRTELAGDVAKPVRISAELLTDPELRDDLRAVARRLAGARSGGSGRTRSGD